MAYMVRAALRSTKDFVNQYSAVEAKVREATSNDPWGAPAVLLQELAEATHNSSDLKEIMEMTFKRLNDSGKNWRHVSKALNLLDYLVKNGADRVLEISRQRLQDIRTLKEFQYIDEDGKDQGVNVRVKSKDLAALIQDDERLNEERAKARQVRQRLGKGSAHAESSVHNYDSDTYSRNRADSFTPYRDDYSYTTSEKQRADEGKTNTTLEDEDREYKRALEESRKMFENEQADRRASQEQLQKALERSKSDGSRARRATEPTVDLFAGSASSNTAAATSFGSGTLPPPPVDSRRRNRQSVVGTNLSGFDNGFADTQPDYEFVPPKKPQAAAQSQPFDPFASVPTSSSTQQQNDPFGSFAAPPSSLSSSSQQNAFNSRDPFATPPLNNKDPFASSSTATTSTTRSTGSGFDAAFDGGKEARKLPHQLAPKGDPNAALAEIARNAPELDGFARLGDSRARSQSVNHSISQPIPVGGSSSFGLSAAAATPANSFNTSSGGFPANSFSPTPATPANSFSQPAGFPSSFQSSFNAPTPQNSFTPQTNAFGAFGPGVTTPPPLYAQPAAAAAYPNAGLGRGAFNPFGQPAYGQPAYGQPAAVVGGAFAPPTSGGFGSSSSNNNNDPFGSVHQDPFASLGSSNVMQPQPLIPMSSSSSTSSSSSRPPNDAYSIVDLSADSLASSRNSKNPFGSTARKYDWEKPKPQPSLNDLKQNNGQSF